MTTELRQTGISLVGNVPWGTHFCHFYETKTDLLDILIPYFQQGLANHECCLWITPEPDTVAAAMAALRTAVPTLDQHLAAKDIEIIPYQQWYQSDEPLDLPWVISAWRERLAQALTRGYAGLRVNGNGVWLPGQDWTDFLSYEAAIGTWLVNQQLLVLCTYPLATTSASQLFDLARLYPFAIIKRYGKWKLLQTPELTQAESEMRQLTETIDQRISERTSELTTTNEALRLEIHERKRIEEQLRYYADLLANVSDAIISTDLGFRIRSWNSAAEMLYGWSAVEVIGRRMREVVRTEYLGVEYDGVTQQLQQAGHWRGEVIQQVKDGTTRTILASVTVLHDAYNRSTGVVAVNRDITERKQLEAENERLATQFHQAQKMESIGRLAGGIAHDFNNLLMPIIGYAELGMRRVAPEQQLYTDLRRIKEAGDRAAGLTRQILAFSRQQLLEMKSLDLNQVVARFEPMLRRLIGEDLVLQTRLATDLPALVGDESQFEQILLNLAVNARDAMPDGGTLTIETAHVELDESYAASHVEIQPGPHVLLAVSDTGHGMDAATQQHIFEPFFTTKGQGQGTGLGLSTVFGIVKQHHGSIWVYSELGHGTTFKIYLPLPKCVHAPAAAVQPLAALGGAETILLVEDESGVRQLVGDILRAHGYQIIEADAPEKGIALAAAHAGPIHLLLSDVIMPQMNGRKLYEQLLTTRPSLKVLFMSGYTDNIIAPHDVLGEATAFLQKPFMVDSLLLKVRKVLD